MDDAWFPAPAPAWRTTGWRRAPAWRCSRSGCLRKVEIPLSRRIRLLPIKLRKSRRHASARTRLPCDSGTFPPGNSVSAPCTGERYAGHAVASMESATSRADRNLRGGPILARLRSIPRGPQHIVSMVMGCSCCKAPHNAAPRRSVAGRQPKGSSACRIRRFSPAAASASLRISGFSREPFADPARPSDRSRRLQRP